MKYLIAVILLLGGMGLGWFLRSASPAPTFVPKHYTFKGDDFSFVETDAFHSDAELLDIVRDKIGKGAFEPYFGTDLTLPLVPLASFSPKTWEQIRCFVIEGIEKNYVISLDRLNGSILATKQKSKPYPEEKSQEMFREMLKRILPRMTPPHAPITDLDDPRLVLEECIIIYQWGVRFFNVKSTDESFTPFTIRIDSLGRIGRDRYFTLSRIG